jgi:hypothetical protein
MPEDYLCGRGHALVWYVNTTYLSERSEDEHASKPGHRTVSAQETEPIRRSIEVEYWVIDEAGRLTEPGALVEAVPGVEREFVEPLLEVKTTPCDTTAAVREELFERLEAVLRRAEDLGKGLVPLATPVGEADIEGGAGGITGDEVVLPEFDAVIGYVNAAIREGVGSEAVRSYLDRMGFDVESFSPVAHEFDDPGSVSRERAREIRLEHAERLQRDVRQRSSVTGV